MCSMRLVTSPFRAFGARGFSIFFRMAHGRGLLLAPTSDHATIDAPGRRAPSLDAPERQRGALGAPLARLLAEFV
jgi:hypothetical protein